MATPMTDLEAADILQTYINGSMAMGRGLRALLLAVEALRDRSLFEPQEIACRKGEHIDSNGKGQCDYCEELLPNVAPSVAPSETLSAPTENASKSLSRP